MALLRYLKPVERNHGLPNPRGELASHMPPAAIAEANRLVQQVITEVQETAGKKRGPYKTYSPTVRLQIAKYASNHGVTLAARAFSR